MKLFQYSVTHLYSGREVKIGMSDADSEAQTFLCIIIENMQPPKFQITNPHCIKGTFSHCEST